MRHLPTLLLTAALLVIPLTIVVEHEFSTTWLNRLYLPEFTPLPDFHTPLMVTGTYLPAVIRENIVLTPDQNPYLITHNTYINPSVIVTIKPGVKIFAAENTSLTVDGQLLAIGTPALPIAFQSNEAHPRNQIWHGITAKPQSILTMQFVAIDDASPAISCLGDSLVTVDNTHIRRGSVGIFQDRSDCTITHSLINGPTIGLSAIDSVINFTNTKIIARQHDILSILQPPQTSN